MRLALGLTTAKPADGLRLDRVGDADGCGGKLHRAYLGFVFSQGCVALPDMLEKAGAKGRRVGKVFTDDAKDLDQHGFENCCAHEGFFCEIAVVADRGLAHYAIPSDVVHAGYGAFVARGLGQDEPSEAAQ